MNRKRWRYRGYMVLGAGLLLCAGCSKQTVERIVQHRPAPSGPKDPELRVDPAGYKGRHFTGPTDFPRASPMDDGTTAYEVVYQKGVVVVSKEDSLRHLVEIAPDGSYVFDAAAAPIARLKPDSVVVLSGVAVRTVVSVTKTRQGYLLKTSVAKITDAVKNGRLEGTYKINFGKMRKAAEYDVAFSGFDYHIRFTPGPDRLNVQATIKYASPQGVMAIAGDGYLSNFTVVTRIQIKNSQVVRLDFLGNNLAGQANMKWYAVANDAMRPGAMAKITSWPAELYKNSALTRAAYDIPILLGALPMDLRVSLGFSFIPDFTTKNSRVEGSKLVSFRGSGGFNFVDGLTKPAGAFNAGSGNDAKDNVVDAAGAVGFTAATEAPRLDLALGWPPASPPLAGYLNFVSSYGLVTSGVNAAPCQSNIDSFSVSAGAAYSSPNTFASWPGTAPGIASSVSLWSKTSKTPGARAGLCSN